jgi:hypothetical protein
LCAWHRLGLSYPLRRSRWVYMMRCRRRFLVRDETELIIRRMGASDDIGRGKSTFMVELSETSDILRTLTPRTLVILDE